MLDELKMSASSFILGLKHGVYVFVSDACDYCKAYKESLRFINNCNLHIVECVTDADKTAIFQLTGKSNLPVTASFVDNELQWATLGQLFMQDEGDEPPEPGTWTLNMVAKYVHDVFGDAPLSEEEVQKKIEKANKKCYFAYYVFPENISDEIRQRQLDNAFKYNELPIDLSEINKLNISEEEKEIMVLSNKAYATLVVFDMEHTDTYSPLAVKLLQTYYDPNAVSAPVVLRGLE